MIKNYMEMAVDRVMGNIMDKIDLACTCERCQLDIKAIALNGLAPHYVVSERGEVYAKVNQLYIQYETDIISRLTSAGSLVAKQPRHNLGLPSNANETVIKGGDHTNKESEE